MRYSGSFVPQAGAGSAEPQAGAGSAEPQAGAGSAEPQAGAALGSAEPQAVPQAGAGSVVPQAPETTLSKLLIFLLLLIRDASLAGVYNDCPKQPSNPEVATNLLGTHLYVSML